MSSSSSNFNTVILKMQEELNCIINVGMKDFCYLLNKYITVSLSLVLFYLFLIYIIRYIFHGVMFNVFYVSGFIVVEFISLSLLI